MKPDKSNSDIKIKGAYDHLKKSPKTSTSKTKTGTPGIMKVFVVLILIFGLFTGLGAFSGDTPIFDDNEQESDYQNPDTGDIGLGISAEVYSSPTCGCCSDYVDILQSQGFDVTHHKTLNYYDIKDEQKVPIDQRSCHTMMVGNYFVEGHIPGSVIIELLNSNPTVDGITLAGMPSGSPGMSGEKSENWDIYSIVDGEAVSIFKTL